MNNKRAFTDYIERRQEQWKQRKIAEYRMLDYKLNSFAVESSLRRSKSYMRKRKAVNYIDDSTMEFLNVARDGKKIFT